MTFDLRAEPAEVVQRTPTAGQQLRARGRRLESALGPWSWAVVVGLAGVFALLDWATQGPREGYFAPNGDGAFFAYKGAMLLSHNGFNVFSDKVLQSGPWQLLAWRGATLSDGVRGGLVADLVVVVGLAVAVHQCARALLRSSPVRELLSLGVVSLLLLWGTIPEAYDSGHIAQVAIPLMWVAAARLAQDRRAWAAGAVFGLSAGVETWGVLGAALILLLPSLRQWVVAGATAAGVVLATYLPFVVFGRFDMLRMHWTVNGDTLLHYVVPVGSPYTFTMRLAQTVLAVGVAGLAVRRVRESAHAPWLLVALVVAIRLVLDAQIFDYYVIPLRIAGLVAVAMFLSERRWVSAAVMGLTTVAVFANGFLREWPDVLALATAAIVCVLAASRDRAIGRSGDLTHPVPQELRPGTENHLVIEPH